MQQDRDSQDNLRERLIDHVKRTYKAAPEYLWRRFPDYAIFRHEDNRKWFGIIMTVPAEKLGVDGYGDEPVDILNVKIPDPFLLDTLIQQPGYLRGYHMSHKNWMSILLDGTIPFEDICGWLAESYIATASKETKHRLRPAKEWIVPSNPKYYDIEHAFDDAEVINWKQGKGIKKNDIVFMYVGAPVSAILYKCKVVDTDIPYKYSDDNLTITALMQIKLLKRYNPDKFTFDILGSEYGIKAVRGPRGIPVSLSEALR